MVGIVLIVLMAFCAGGYIELAAGVKGLAGQCKYLGHLASEGNGGAIGCDLVLVFADAPPIIL